MPTTPAAERGGRSGAASEADAIARDRLLATAEPLLMQLHGQGFTVMRSGLPADPQALSDAVAALSSGLALLAPEPAAPHRAFGVYLGAPVLAWFEDGYGGTTGLAIPAGTPPAEIADFVRSRLRARSARASA